MRGALLWTRRGIWWRRICWRAERSAKWLGPTKDRSWIYELIARYRQGGYEALEPRSGRRPRSLQRHSTPEEVVRAILSLRERLAAKGMIADQRRSPTTSPKNRGRAGAVAHNDLEDPAP